MINLKFLQVERSKSNQQVRTGDQLIFTLRLHVLAACKLAVTNLLTKPTNQLGDTD